MAKKPILIKEAPEKKSKVLVDDPVWTEVNAHYSVGTDELQTRITDDLRGFDMKDKIFLSHIDSSKWPYNAKIFDPLSYTTVMKKTGRLVTSKLRGRFVPRKGGTVLGGQIINALHDFQWDDANHYGSMITKSIQMDLNVRKYGGAFAFVPWMKIEDEGFDGPEYIPWNNRDVITQPGATSIQDSDWVQLRRFVTLYDLERLNEGVTPKFQNLNKLREAVFGSTYEEEESEAKTDDKAKLEVKSVSREILGLETSYSDVAFRKIEIVTEYRRATKKYKTGRWITFAPQHGLILRDIPGPYKHGKIPVTRRVYYPTGDDIYGLGEFEPVAKIQKAINALWSAYLDEVNLRLKTPLKISLMGNVQMHTLEFSPGSKWIMDDLNAVAPVELPSGGIATFTSTYGALLSSFNNAVQGAPTGVAQESARKLGETATGVKFIAGEQNIADAFNRIFLEEEMKELETMWLALNKQFITEETVVRVVGKPAMQYFQKRGLTEGELTEGGEEIAPKLTELTSAEGFLTVEEGDLEGTYDFIPDVGSTVLPNEEAEVTNLVQAYQMAVQAQPLLAQEGVKIKIQEILERIFEKAGIRDAEGLFEETVAPGMEGGMPGGMMPGAEGGAPEGGTPAPEGEGMSPGIIEKLKEAVGGVRQALGIGG